MANREFDLDSYETVKSRKARFYGDYKDGRIVVEQLNHGGSVLEYSEFKAYVYRNAEDQKAELPWATGHALELRNTKLSVSKDGKKYASVNYTSWLENAEESAVGRALDNAGYASSPSREEMKRVEEHTRILNVNKTSSGQETAKDNGLSDAQKSKIEVLRKQKGLTGIQLKDLSEKLFSKGYVHLTKAEASKLIDQLDRLKDK